MLSTINKETLETLPIVEFMGDIRVINDFSEAAKAVKEIREANKLIGFDTESRPSFKKGVTYKVALVQLSVENTAFLFRLNKMGGLGSDLMNLLSDPKCIKVGLATHDDFTNLKKWDDTLTPKGIIEIQDMIGSYGIEDKSLAKIYAILFGMKISKRQRLTNWEADQLTEKQCHYAAFDAVACVEIYNKLLQMGNAIFCEL